MKNNTLKYIVACLILILAIAVVVAQQAGKKNASQGPLQGAVQGTSTAPSVTGAVSQSPKPVPVVKATTGVAPKGTYADYQARLAADLQNQGNCKAAATPQYDQLYKNSMQSSSFTSSYNTKTGICYMEVTGKVQAPYSTNKTGHIYFRNVTKNSLIMECIDVIGATYTDNEWSCSDKISGQTINKAQYNAMLYAYLTQ